MPRGKEAAASTMKLIGPIAFYVGLLISLVAMFITPSGWLYVGLAVLGIIAGLANVTAKETGPYLFASIAFIITALGMTSLITLNGVVIPAELIRLAANITVFVGAGAVLIALKAIYGIAKSG
ncbi:MAG: hypothetical protein AB1476_00610 [Candidatus Hadarchaeota archaeon]